MELGVPAMIWLSCHHPHWPGTSPEPLRSRWIDHIPCVTKTLPHARCSSHAPTRSVVDKVGWHPTRPLWHTNHEHTWSRFVVDGSHSVCVTNEPCPCLFLVAPPTELARLSMTTAPSICPSWLVRTVLGGSALYSHNNRCVRLDDIRSGAIQRDSLCVRG